MSLSILGASLLQHILSPSALYVDGGAGRLSVLRTIARGICHQDSVLQKGWRVMWRLKHHTAERADGQSAMIT